MEHQPRCLQLEYLWWPLTGDLNNREDQGEEYSRQVQRPGGELGLVREQSGGSRLE